jgi:pimeloyl-ACP methyl ester carboxylesterase
VESSTSVLERYAGLAADVEGRDDERPPLVLLHGLTFDRRMWRPALAELARIDPGRKVVSLDLPGHGESAGRDSYSMDEVAEQVHAAVEEAGLRTPVVVGHSISGVVATVYAARYPTRGVVNVDQSLRVQPMTELVQSLADRLRGPDFDAVWSIFWASMKVDLLPPRAQELVRTTCRPAQELVLAYWDDVLTTPVAELSSRAAAGLAAVREAAVPYLVVAGDEPGESYRAWLAGVIPQATVEVFPGTGHFPHLADPARFASDLAATARGT